MTKVKIKEEILNAIAPCSMFCITCTGCQYGQISDHARKLLHLLEGHEEFLDKNLLKEYRHKLDEFKIFYKKLDKYAYPKCGGCRNNKANGCSIKGCIIPECTKKHHVDFCAQCSEFPCDNVNESIYKKTTIEKWLKGNTLIKKIGIEKYFENNKNIPHYINYAKIEKKQNEGDYNENN